MSTRPLHRFLLALSLAAAAACADDSDRNGADTAGDTSVDTAATDTTADAEVDAADAAAAETGADAGADAVSDTAADTATDAAADTAAERLVVNGCSYATATDMTGAANVDVSSVAAWRSVHQVCIIVSAGTNVTWSGNFESHPLVGGVTGTVDPESPITIAGPGGDAETVTATLSAAGDYPYFCTIHTILMQGVIYVD